MYDFLTAAQNKKFKKWYHTLSDAYTGAVGGRITFEITPTSIFNIIVAKDLITKRFIDLTES